LLTPNAAASLRQLQWVEPSLGFFAGGGQNAGAQSWGDDGSLLAGMIGVQPVEPELQEAPLPANDGGSAGLEADFDGVERYPRGQHEDQLGPKDIAGGQRTRLHNAAEFQALVWGKAAFIHTSLEA
jgi:hypothetical protein